MKPTQTEKESKPAPEPVITKPMKVHILSFAGYLDHHLPKISRGHHQSHKSMMSATPQTLSKSVSATFKSSSKNKTSTSIFKKVYGLPTFAVPFPQPIQAFQPKSSKERTELAELRLLQKNMNKDFSFYEKNAKVPPKEPVGQTHRLQNTPAKFMLAVLMGRLEQIENYLGSFCAGAVERRALINSEDECGRSVLFYAVFKSIFFVVVGGL